MSTLLAQLTTAAMAALQAAPAVCSQVDRIRLQGGVATTTSQAVVVRAGRAASNSESAFSDQPLLWVSELTVECYARTTAAQPDAVVDPLIEAVYARLMADTTLGGVLISLEPRQVDVDYEANADKAACATLTFHASHRASPGSFS